MKTSCDQGLGGSIPIFDKGNQGAFRKKSLKGLLVGLMSLAVTQGVVAEEVEAHGYWQQSAVNSEAFVDEPMPQGISVKVTEFDGPVFTNSEGKTLYTWPLKGLRNGDVG